MTDVGFGSLDRNMKGIITLLGIVAVIVPCVLGFVNFDKRVDLVEVSQRKETDRNEKHFDKLDGDVDSNRDVIHSIQLVIAGQTVQYGEILRRLEEQGSILKNLERVD